MKKSFLLLFFAVAAFTGCKKSSPAPANTASVMFMNGCTAGATPVTLDVKVNSVAVANAQGMQFLKASGYQFVSAGSGVNISYYVTGLSLLANTTATFAVSGHYSAFAGGSILAPAIILTTDDLTAPSSGQAKIRFVNLCGDNMNTSCYFGATKLDSNINYQGVTPFIEVAPGTAKLAMIDQVVLTNSGQINSQQLVAGKIYTAVLTGSVSGTGASVLTLTLLNNN